jgi:hypothetical protein
LLRDETPRGVAESKPRNLLMTIKMTQKELGKIYDEEEIVVSYKTAFQVAHTGGVGFYLKPILKTRGLPYTAKARFHVVSLAKFQKWEGVTA